MARAVACDVYISFRFAFRVKPLGGEWSELEGASRILSDLRSPHLIIERAHMTNRPSLFTVIPLAGEIEVLMYGRPELQAPGSMTLNTITNFAPARSVRYQFAGRRYVNAPLSYEDRGQILRELAVLQVLDEPLKVYLDAAQCDADSEQAVVAILEDAHCVAVADLPPSAMPVTLRESPLKGLSPAKR